MNYLRIKKKKEITGLLKNGKRSHASSLTVVYGGGEKTAMAVCVGKKYGKSTQRNRIKRLLREAFRIRADKLEKPQRFLLIPKVAEEYSFAVYQREIGKILKRERLIENQHPKSDCAEYEISAQNGI